MALWSPFAHLTTLQSAVTQTTYELTPRQITTQLRLNKSGSLYTLLSFLPSILLIAFFRQSRKAFFFQSRRVWMHLIEVHFWKHRDGGHKLSIIILNGEEKHGECISGQDLLARCERGYILSNVLPTYSRPRSAFYASFNIQMRSTVFHPEIIHSQSLS